MVKTRDIDTKKNYYKNYRGFYSRGSSARGRNNYYSRRGYSCNNGKYFHNKQWEKISSGQNSRAIPRPLSPVEGSEEFMARKIQQTSAIIMRQLLSPNEPLTLSPKLANKDIETHHEIGETNPKENEEKQNEKCLSKTKKFSTNEINVKEIHDKIMSRITNLNEGRKKNFINAHAHNTSLDSAIQHIHKQKRLELSRVLRDMCSSSENLQKTGELINSIIPDIGIKLEELPIDVIQELRQTLNLDLDEDILNSPGPTILDSVKIGILDSASPAIFDSASLSIFESASRLSDSLVTVSSEELNAAIDSIQVKTEQDDNLVHSGSIEIKPEDILDFDNLYDTQCNSEETEPSRAKEAAIQGTESGQKKIIDSALHCVIVKEEPSEENDCQSVATTFSESTVLFRNSSGSHEELDTTDRTATLDIFDEKLDIYETDIQIDSSNNPTTDTRPNTEHYENASSQTENSLGSLENFISQCIEDDDVLDMSDINEVSVRVEIVDRCLKYLSEYKQLLVKSVLGHCYKMQCLSKNREGIGISQNEASVSNNNTRQVSNQASQTLERVVVLEDEDKRATKRRKVENQTQKNKVQIKTEQSVNELREEQDFLIFPKLQDRVMVIEKVANQLVLATESGNVIYASLKDGAFLHTIDVTNSPITSLIFLKGINEFIFMYVGCLDKALRIYDFESRNIKKVTPLVDHIRCMDAMWDYVFIGCRGGTLLRYSTKRGKIEFEEKNTGADILVIKAAQEGPRRVLLVGHKQAPIYVRDAMSGLYLRNFSNEAITPTVYALIVNNNHLYCGTAQNNILVFSFHEGTLLQRLFAAKCKGISCMKIFKDLLFSGCYNGSIYVHHLKINKLLTTLKGPGGSISSMEVLSNQVIVGTLTGKFGSVAVPAEVYLHS